ncbi:MAG: efflux RND transporter periplasmic adaptor subunit [Bacteroidota bacterium]|nr:efflux RND transporter periplasmic adaptor subunit [Candidatus Kapabacteria bacterium]MDW8220943.1 efflux RND transporter periplasmic adaptor subunit [Bacteroidota bacterium]
MKSKIIGAAVTLLALGLIVMTLINNKAKSKAKAEQSSISTVLPVQVQTVRYAQLHDDVTLVGTVLANNEVNVISETSGRVIQVYVRVGDKVSAGTVLAAVDDELRQAALLSAQANFDKAKADYDRTEALFKERAVAEAQLDAARLGLKAAEAQLITARRQVKDTRITSPIAGYVTARLIDKGVTLVPGAPVATIVDISTLKVRVNVAESEVFKLKAGDNVRITTDVYPNVVFEGRITAISVKGDEAHTYPVEITFANSTTHPLRAGMFARVAFTSIQRDTALVIPREALVGSVKDARVYVVERGSVARLRNIVVGAEANGKLAVVHGLSLGEAIVVVGQNNLRDSTAVSVVKVLDQQ